MASVGLSPAYVLDTMQWYEVNALLDGYDLVQRDGWEKVRTLAVASLQSNSTKRLKAKKVFPLPWDKMSSTRKAEKAARPSEEYIQHIEEMALACINSESREEVNLNKLKMYGE